MNQTIAFSSKFHAHRHVPVTGGILTPGGGFPPLQFLDTSVLAQSFRRLLLDRLHETPRFSGRLRETLLRRWNLGFSGDAGQRVSPGCGEQLARCLIRLPFATGSVTLTPDGRVLVFTTPDHSTGQEDRILDYVEWGHVLTTRIPDLHENLTRLNGAYAYRGRQGHDSDQLHCRARHLVGANPWSRRSREERRYHSAARPPHLGAGHTRIRLVSPTPQVRTGSKALLGLTGVEIFTTI